MISINGARNGEREKKKGKKKLEKYPTHQNNR